MKFTLFGQVNKTTRKPHKYTSTTAETFIVLLLNQPLIILGINLLLS